MSYLSENFELLETKSHVLKTMGHPIRLAILLLLIENTSQNVTEIYSNLEIEQAVASHHLRIMKSANILKSAKDGKNVIYSVQSEEIKSIVLHLIN